MPIFSTWANPQNFEILFEICYSKDWEQKSVNCAESCEPVGTSASNFSKWSSWKPSKIMRGYFRAWELCLTLFSRFLKNKSKKENVSSLTSQQLDILKLQFKLNVLVYENGLTVWNQINAHFTRGFFKNLHFCMNLEMSKAIYCNCENKCMSRLLIKLICIHLIIPITIFEYNHGIFIRGKLDCLICTWPKAVTSQRRVPHMPCPYNKMGEKKKKKKGFSFFFVFFIKFNLTSKTTRSYTSALRQDHWSHAVCYRGRAAKPPMSYRSDRRRGLHRCTWCA